MPRIRTIKPKFWDDIKLSKISRDARLLFIGIWNFSDDLGVIVAEPVWIKSKVFPYDKLEPEQFENWVQELVDKKFILPITYNEELFFYIRTFDRHQRIEKPNHTDICIDKEELMRIIEQSRINPVLIQEPSLSNPVSIEGGREGNRKGIGIVKGIGMEGNVIPENFTWGSIYYKSFGQVKKIYSHLSEPGFLLWKKFIDLILEKNYTELFNCKFVNPQDFEKLDFPESKWDETLKSLLSTGIKQEHNLYFRIPKFITYNNGSNKFKGGASANGSGVPGTSIIPTDKKYSAKL